MQFINSSLEKLIKKLADNEFKYLTQEFGSTNLELVKKKMLFLMSTWTILKDLVKKNYLKKNSFTAP